MDNSILNKLLISIVDLGVETLKGKLNNYTQDNKIKSKLQEFSTRQFDLFMHSSFDTTIDYQSLSDYLALYAIDDIKKYIFNLNSELDDTIIKTIYSKALNFSNATIKCDEEFVKKYIDTAVKIIKDFYMEMLDEKDKIILKTLKDDFHSIKIYQSKNHDEIMARLKQNDVTDAVIPHVQKVEIFEFGIDKKGKMMPVSIRTKNIIRDWYLKDRSKKFEVVINDERIILLNQSVCDIEEKINQQSDLTLEEESKYESCIKAINKCNHEKTLKGKAIEFYLKDEFLQSYMLCKNYSDLFAFIEKIINFNYYDNAKYSDWSYVTLDFTLNPAPKECNNYFLVNVERKKFENIFKNKKLNIPIDIFWLDIIDLGKELLCEVAIKFYLFLAEEIIVYHNNGLEKNKKILNLLNYKVGLH